MSKRVKQKTSAMLMASLLAVSSMPMANNLLVYADDYSGGNSSSNGNYTTVQDGTGINYSDYGIRIYAIDSQGNIKTGNGGKYIVDLWYDSSITDRQTIMKNCSTACRFNGNVSIDNIIISNFSTGVNSATGRLKSPDMKMISDTTALNQIPAFAWTTTNAYGQKEFIMSGDTFKTWATTDVQDRKGRSNWNITLLYYGLTAISLEATDFLVIEPMMYAPTAPYTYSACTWYSYLTQLGSNLGGSQMTTKATWGSGFTLTKGKPMANLNPPDRPFTINDTIGSVGDVGWGIHILKSEPIGEPTKDPIDTYNITEEPTPTYPDKSETPHKDPEGSDNPEFDNTGEKTIIKTYVDLYKDENNSTYYTKAIDQGTYIEHETSDKVVITDESDVNGGYEVVAWYTSGTDTSDESIYNTDSLHGTDMLQTTDRTDWIHKPIGQEQFTLDGYTSITGVSSNTGHQSYSYIQGGDIKTTDNSPQYTKTPDTHDITEGIKKDDTTNDYKPDEYINLGGDNTIVLLYVREHGWINTDKFTGGGNGSGTGSSGGGTGTGTGTGDNDTLESGELKIVKCYGIADPITHEIIDATDREPVVKIADVTRNVHIEDENDKGYSLSEYVYSTRGNQVDQWDKMTASSWGQLTGNKESDDTSFYLKGFIDGFSESDKVYGSDLYSSKYAWHDTETAIGDTAIHDTNTDTYAGELVYPGTYGTGRLSGNLLRNYNKTIYFDMDDPDNTDPTDDVLYLLFLKDDPTMHEADGFIIPESYITRHNDFATNNITVTSNLTGNTTSYLFAEHKFTYALPFVTGVTNDQINEWNDPYIIANISQTNTTPNSGLVNKWSRTEGLTNITDLTTGTVKRHSSADNVYRVAYESKNLHSGLLKFTNANYSYVAFRKGDKPTIAQWKTEAINSTTSSGIMDTSSTRLSDWKNGQQAFQGIDNWNTDIVAYGNTPSGTRATNNSTSIFDLALDFTDTWAEDYIGFTGTEFDNVPLLNTDSTDTLVKGNNMFRTAQASLSDGTKELKLQSKYVKDLSDLSVVQKIEVQTYYATDQKPNTYSDEVTPITTGSGTGSQSGGVQIMKQANTISFYPYHVMQFDTNTVYNTAKKANGEPNPNSNASEQGYVGQVYVLGEQLRTLNCYGYSGVSFTSGNARNTDGTINIVNQANNNAKGKIVIVEHTLL